MNHQDKQLEPGRIRDNKNVSDLQDVSPTLKKRREKKSSDERQNQNYQKSWMDRKIDTYVKCQLGSRITLLTVLLEREMVQDWEER